MSDEQAKDPGTRPTCWVCRTPLEGLECPHCDVDVRESGAAGARTPRYRCSGCWLETDNNRGWMWFNFKHLVPAWLCPTCQREWKEHMEKIQGAGL